MDNRTDKQTLLSAGLLFSMNLDDLNRVGLIKIWPKNESCVENMLQCAKRKLADAVASSLSNASRFLIAYDVILQCTLAALYLQGYQPNWDRPRVEKTMLMTLPHSLGFSHQKILTLTSLWQVKIDAEILGADIDEDVVELCIFEGNEMIKLFYDWLGERH